MDLYSYWLNLIGVSATFHSEYANNTEPRTNLDNANTVAQLVTGSLSIAATLTGTVKANPEISIALAASGTLAEITGKAVYQQDLANGKFNGLSGLSNFINDASSIVGDAATIFGGAFGLLSILSPNFEVLSKAADVVGDTATFSGLEGQLVDAIGGTIPTQTLSARLGNALSKIGSLLNQITDGLKSTPLNNAWQAIDSPLLTLFNQISATLNSSTDADFASNAAKVGDTLSGIESNISNFIQSILNNYSAPTSTPQQAAAGAGALTAAYQQAGTYLVTPGDTWDSIASDLNSTGAAIPIDGDTLSRVNAALGVTTLTPGDLIHVPAASLAANFVDESSSGPGYTYVFDSSSNTMFKVGATIDASDSGGLTIDTADQNGNFATFAAGTYGDVTLQPDGTVQLTLLDPNTPAGGAPLATLDLNPSTGAATETFMDGLSITSQASEPINIQAPASDASADQVIVGYLAALGDSLSASQLDQFDSNYLNPSGAGHTVIGDPVETTPTQADVYYSADTPGAIIAGQDTAMVEETVNGHDQLVQVDAYNILQAGNADISQDAISNVQELDTEGGTVTLTTDQFNSFGNVTGGGALIAATGGTLSLVGAAVDSDSQWTGLTATDWTGTTLIGNNEDNQTLTASEFGSDALQAGDGIGDVLNAGLGMDTLVGGSGGDTFVALNGLSAGSTIEGNGAGNLLEVNGDISQSSISGIQTVKTGDLALSASQLAGFDQVQGTIVGNELFATSGGTFDLSSIPTTGTFNLTALSNDGTTLISDGRGGETLTASQTGADTLDANGGGSDTLIAGGGVDNLIASGSFDVVQAEDGLAPGSTVLGSGTTILDANGDISGATLSGISVLSMQADQSVTLTASQLAAVGGLDGMPGDVVFAATGGSYLVNGTYNLAALSDDGTTLQETGGTGGTLTDSTAGNDTLISIHGVDTVLDASGSTGDVTLNTVGDLGGDTILAGSGTDTIDLGFGPTAPTALYGGTGTDTIIANGTMVAGSIIQGGGGPTTLELVGNISAGTVTGVQTLETDSATLSNSEFDQFTSIGYLPGGPDSGLLLLSDGGTYNLDDNSSVEFSMYAASNDGTTMIGDDADHSVLAASTLGDDVLMAGNGAQDVLEDGGGIDTLDGGTGGDIFIIDHGTDGTTVSGQADGNFMLVEVSDISEMLVSGIQTAEPITPTLTLTSDELSGFSNLINQSGASITLEAADSGTYNLADVNAMGTFDLDASDAAGDVTLIGNDQNSQTLTGGAGFDTLQAGNGQGDTLYAGDGPTVLIAGSGADTLVGGDDMDIFEFKGAPAPGTEIDGLKAGDIIELPGSAVSAFGVGANSLNIATDAGTYVFSDVTFDSNIGGYSAMVDPTTGLEAITLLACFLRGTLIRTENGDRPIESLRIGDRVRTLSGAAKPIRWIGRRRYSPYVAASCQEVLPIRMKRGSLGRGLPLRDLWVSPEHAMYIQEVLVPASALVNSVTIMQDRGCVDVSYFHLEFDEHEVIFAEGAATESYVDDASRDMFDNAEEFRALYPHAIQGGSAVFCAPRIEDGELLEAIRAGFMENAQPITSASHAGRLHPSARPHPTVELARR